MNQLGHEVGTGRGNQNGIGFPAQVDVRHVVAFTGVPLRGVNSLTRERLHGDRSDELGRRLRHDHLDFCAGFDKRSAKLSRLETGNATGES